MFLSKRSLDNPMKIGYKIERKEAREWLMKLLFGASFEEPWSAEMISEWILHFDIPEKQRPFIESSFLSIQEHLVSIDAEITSFIKGWEFSRIPRIDKAILRLATNEILFDESIPVSVSINEAVELGKKYGNETSYRFLNGILGSIARKAEDSCNEPYPSQN